MKRKTMLIGLFAAAGVITSYDALTNFTGAPSGVSGSPASNNQTCAQSGCHGGGPAVSTQSITISSDIPSSGFVPNTNYTITVTADAGSTGSSRIGFEASIEDASGHVGTLTAGAGNMKVGNFITHTSAGTSTSTNSKSWNFTWNSGSTPGDAEVYTAVNFSNANGVQTGDVIATNTLSLTKDQGIGMEERILKDFSVSPNPASDWIELNGLTDVAAIHIFSLDGKLIESLNSEKVIYGDIWKMNIEFLKAGTYFIAADGGEYSVQTLIVED